MPIALITGSTSGIGAGFAETYAKLDHNLVLVARDRTRLEAQAARLHEQWQVDVEVLVADLGTDDGCAAVEARVADEDQPIDVLINNAGFGMGRDFLHSALADEEQLLRVMVRAPMRITKAALPGMLARDSGTIITVASTAAFLNHSTYGAAKAWAVRFSETPVVEAGRQRRASDRLVPRPRAHRVPRARQRRRLERAEVDVAGRRPGSRRMPRRPASRQGRQHSDASLQGADRGRAAAAGDTSSRAPARCRRPKSNR